MKQPTKQTWSSQITYILTVAGATIGFGATWRFPYLVGENGGGAYVFVFCIAMLMIGIPMILVENVIGRRLRKNSIDAFSGSANGKAIPKLWQLVGWLGVLGAFGIMAFYMVLGGEVLAYIIGILNHSLSLTSPITAATTNAYYTFMFEDNATMLIICTMIFILINWLILAKGVIAGIERSVKYLMPLLFICLVIMICRNITLPGAMEGIRFYLEPDFSKITPKLFIQVLGQVFFALSLGFGVIITLSSFLDKKEKLVRTATITGIINTIIAVMAGFMIFPSLLSSGIPVDSGSSLVFKSLPIAFSNMWAGNYFAIVFFSLLLIAALTTTLPIYEVIITILEEKFNIARQKAIYITISVIFVCGNLPSILSLNVWKHIKICNRNIFDLFNDISGDILFVLTALGCAIFVGWVLQDDAKKELQNDTTAKSWIIDLWFYYVKYVVPFVIVAIFISNFVF